MPRTAPCTACRLRFGAAGPRKYGERAPTPQAWLRERVGWRQVRLAVRGRAVPCTYRVEGPYRVRGAPDRPLFLLVVRGLDRLRQGHRRQRQPAYWLVSAVKQADGGWGLPYPAARRLGWAWQRWEIEVTHREVQCGFGVGVSQCWNPTATVLSCAMAGVGASRAPEAETGEAAGAEAPRGCPVPPLGCWWTGGQQWSFGQLWQAVRQELWQVHAFPQEVRRIVDHVPEHELWAPAVEAAVLGARRG